MVESARSAASRLPSAAIRLFVARMWPRWSRAWKARPVPSTSPAATPMPQVRASWDRPLLTVSDRRMPMLRARRARPARTKLARRSSDGHKLNRRVRPSRDDHLLIGKRRRRAADGGLRSLHDASGNGVRLRGRRPDPAMRGELSSVGASTPRYTRARRTLRPALSRRLAVLAIVVVVIVSLLGPGVAARPSAPPASAGATGGW